MSNSLRQVPTMLVLTGNQSPLAAGNGVTDLAVGQIGVFNKDGLSRSAATDVPGEEFFLATKLADGKIIRSKGFISSAHLRNWDVQCPVAKTEQVVDITNICAECDTDYSVKLDVNYPVAWHTYGFQPYVKTFTAKTACCDADGTGDCTELVRDLRDNINADSEGIFTASARNPSGLAELNDAALDAWDADANGCPVLRIAMVTPAVPAISGAQANLFTFPELLTATVTTKGFECCSPATAVANSTDPVVQQGDGVTVAMEERFSGGVSGNTSPYRQTVSGVDAAVQLNADQTTTYAILTLEYNDPSQNSFQDFTDPMIVRVAIAPANSNSTDNLGDILDDLLGLSAIDTALTAC